MPRRLRIEFEEAIDHVMAQRDARQKIVRDDADRRRLIGGLEHADCRLLYLGVSVFSRELVEWLGRPPADSARSRTRRLEARPKASPELSKIWQGGFAVSSFVVGFRASSAGSHKMKPVSS
jgi:hypothetical protein